MFEFDGYGKFIGANIRKERVARNISTTEFADLLDCSTSTVRLIERGKRGVTTENLIKISKIFNKSIDSLIFSNADELTLLNESIESERKNKKQETLNSLVYGLSEREIDFLIETAKNLRTMIEISNDKDIEY